jgi:hypothetical protein
MHHIDWSGTSIFLDINEIFISTSAHLHIKKPKALALGFLYTFVPFKNGHGVFENQD